MLNEDIKINEKRKSSFSLLLRCAFLCVAQKQRKGRLSFFIDFNIYIYITIYYNILYIYIYIYIYIYFNICIYEVISS